MAQIYADKRGVLGVANELPAPIQTKRVAYTIKSGDVSQGYASVPVAWDLAFADTNYTLHFTLERATGNDLPNAYYTCQATLKTASGFTANIGLVSADLGGGGGDQIVIHAIAFHD